MWTNKVGDILFARNYWLRVDKRPAGAAVRPREDLESNPMDAVHADVFEFAMKKIKDGFVFERFAQDLLCQIVGQEFLPIGGVGDRGIDGLEHCFTPKGVSRTVYQLSIEADSPSKIRNTLAKLRENDIDCARFIYVTNQIITDQDKLVESLYEEFQVTVIPRDLAWLRGNVNKTEGTIRTFHAFIESNMHQITKPGMSYELTALEHDPHIFVFLRQQWERYGDKELLDELLTDSLIILALEGTDPEQNIFRSRQEILDRIRELVGFVPAVVEGKIDARLDLLSSKSHKRINRHRPANKYCLPYQTRLELEQKNLEDQALHEEFFASAKDRLRSRLTKTNTRVQDALKLLNETINSIFKQQGLEFADFVIRAESSKAIEKSLNDIVNAVVQESSVIPKNKRKVADALLGTIREIIYKGTAKEAEYLKKLSNSYMMLFMLQCNPNVSTFFSTLAGKLRVFVCTSILVPALSEFTLKPQQRRHWNLLRNASNAGIRLIINKNILRELVAHIKKSIQAYEDRYRWSEYEFMDENLIQLIEEIMIRAYFYSRLEGSSGGFSEFIENFVTPDAYSHQMEEDLIAWLKHYFGIEYVEDQAWNIQIDEEDLRVLTEELAKHKRSHTQAENDAKTILAIYAIREKNNEKGDSGIFGYQTWWLSKDTTTHRAVMTCFEERHHMSCYMRTDFLYNYISLAPNREQTEGVFNTMFPTLMGVSISHHLPREIIDAVGNFLREHQKKLAENPGRVKSILKSLIDKLKTDATANTAVTVRHYLEDELWKLEGSQAR